jgi:hypothetical protein
MTRNVRGLIAVLALTISLAACSEDDAQKAVDQAKDRASSAIKDADLPDVDWDKYSGELQKKLDELADNADCSGLKRELAKAENNDTDLTRYIKAQLRKADC